MSLQQLFETIEKGGPNSGNRGHGGISGHRGGSTSKGTIYTNKPQSQYGIGEWVNAKNKLTPIIIDTPSGKYTIAGSKIPDELTREAKSGFKKVKVAKVFNTENEAKQALINAGVKRFQMVDTSWHDEEKE